jgi:hypothetical protein
MSATALDGDVNYKHIDIARVNDPAYSEARKKVEVVVRDDWQARLPVETPALLEVTTKNGAVLRNARQYPTGTLLEPLTLDFVKDLFVKYVGDNLSHPNKIFAANAIGELEKLDRNDVNHLIDILNRGRE